MLTAALSTGVVQAAGAQTYDLSYVDPPRVVYALARDLDGRLWMGGFDDLIRHDGASLESFNGRAPYRRAMVSRIAVTPDGAVWIGLGVQPLRPDADGRPTIPEGRRGGLLRFRDGRFQAFSEADGLGREAVLSLRALPGAGLLVGTRKGLWQQRGERFEAVPAATGQEVLALESDGEGGALLGTMGGLFRLRAGRLESMPLHRPVTALARDPTGRLLVGTFGGVSVVGTDAVERTFTVADGLPGGDVRALLVATDGAVWIGTTRGLARVLSGEVRAFTTATGLSDDAVATLLDDGVGGVWVGTEEGGLTRLVPRAVRKLGPSDGLEGQARAVLRRRVGGVWVATTTRLYIAEGAHGGFERRADLPEAPRTLAEAPDGSLWIGTARDGLLRVPPDAGPVQRYRRSDGLPADDIGALVVASDGDLWIGWSGGGISRIRVPPPSRSLTPAHIASYTSADGLCPGPVRVATIGRDGTGWFGSAAGLSRLQGGRARCFTTADGLGAPGVAAILEDADGDLWVGSRPDGGIALRRGDRFFAFSEKDGLHYDSVYQIVDDGRGHLWLACAAGILRVAKAPMRAAAPGPRQGLPSLGFGTPDGLESARTALWAQPAATVDGKGAFWVVTAAGLSVIAAPAALPTVRPSLDQVSLDGALVPPHAEVLSARGDRFDLAFNLAAPLFVPATRPSYRYRLAGWDPGWRTARGPERLTYPGLAPGRYDLQVQVTDGDGFSSRELRVPVLLAPVLYRRPTFLVGTAALLAAAVLAIQRWRGARLRARFAAAQNDRARMARDLHDLLGQSFASIGLHLDAIRRSLPDAPAPIRELLQRTKAVVAHARQEVRQTIWGLRSPEVERQPLEAALAALIEVERRARAGHSPTMTLEVIGLPVRLPAAAEDEVAQIAREALTNALCHAGASEVRVELTRTPALVRLIIKDDGRGFDQPLETLAARGHFGIVGMHERAARAGATLAVHTAPGAGTEVQLEIPVGTRAENLS